MSVLPVQQKLCQYVPATQPCKKANNLLTLHVPRSSLSDKFRQDAEANNDQQNCTERKLELGRPMQYCTSSRQVQYQLMVIIRGTHGRQVTSIDTNGTVRFYKIRTHPQDFFLILIFCISNKSTCKMNRQRQTQSESPTSSCYLFLSESLPFASATRPTSDERSHRQKIGAKRANRTQCA